MKFFEVKLPPNRKFGLFFTAIFLLASSYSHYVDSEVMFYIFGIICLIFLIITIIHADTLLPLNKLWMKFGILLGIVVSPIIMGIIFFGIFTPIAIIMRLSGRDELRLRFQKKKTHWINRKAFNALEFFKKQF
jgi:hypothetical protein